MHLTKSIRILLTAAVAAMAMSALVASSASASIVPAKFSNSSFKLTSTGITVKGNGIEPKTCTPSSYIEGYAENSNFLASNPGFAETKFSCTGGTSFSMVLLGEAQYDTVANHYILHVNSFSSWSLNSPYGGYWQESESTATWLNGSGSTASTITFTEQTLGHTFFPAGKKISISGTFKATTLSGGLLTLSH